MSRKANSNHSKSSNPRRRLAAMGVSALLVLAVWTVFGQTIHQGFVYDDVLSVYENPMIIQGVTWEGILQLFTHIDPSTHDWWPLTEITHMVDWQIYGGNAGGHHLTNVLLHLTTAILLFLLLEQMTGVLWRSAFVAAVFAIHPLRVESVAWVTERKDVLSGMFFMLTLWAYIRHARSFPAPNPAVRFSKSFLPVLVFYAAGLMSKSMLVTLPFILLLLDYWPLQRWSILSRSTVTGLVVEKIPLLALTAASGVITLVAQRQTALQATQNIALPWRLGNAVVAYVDYIGQMIWPSGLVVLYPHPGNRLSLWTIGGSLLLLSLISVAIIAAHRKRPYLLTGWLWYLIMLLPVIGVVPVGGGQMAQADRFTYLPQIGLYILVTWGAVDLVTSWRYSRTMLFGSAAVVLSGLIATAHVQTGYWKSEVSLWSHALSYTTGNCVAHNNLGNALADRGDLPEAIEHYKQALQMAPSYAEAHYNLGDALSEQGKMAESIQHYEAALECKPDYPKAHNNLGKALLHEGSVDGAITHFQRAMEISPGYSPPYNNLAWVLATHPNKSVRNGARAVDLAKRAADLSVDKDPLILDTLAAAYAEAGRFPEAVRTENQAIEAARARSKSSLVTTLEAHLELYQANQPLMDNSLGR